MSISGLPRDRVGAVALKALVGLALVGSSACHQAYVKMSLAPHKSVCSGTPVILEWASSQEPALSELDASDGSVTSSSQPVRRSTNLASAGRMSVMVTKPTSFRLDAGVWGGRNMTDADVTTYDPASAEFQDDKPNLTIGVSGSEVSCNKDSAWGAIEQTPEHWDPRLTIGKVRARGSATISVWHAGRQDTVSPDGSPAFEGTPMVGVWMFEAGCKPKKPRTLYIEVTASCKELNIGDPK